MLAISITACSIANFYSEDLDKSNIKDTSYNIVKCPTIFIPKETYKHTLVIDNKKSRFKIEKVEFICKEETNKSKLLLDFKVYINAQTSFNINNNDVLPQIYLAIIDSRYEKVLTKIISKTNTKKILKSNKNHKMINKGKFKIKYNNELISDINIYIGIQT